MDMNLMTRNYAAIDQIESMPYKGKLHSTC